MAKMTKKKLIGRLKFEWQYHAMMLPAVILIFIFNYMPAYGNLMAFMDYGPGLGMKSPWCGFDNFAYIFVQKSFWRAAKNTLIIGSTTYVLSILLNVTVALLLNEIHKGFVRKTYQTLMYLPGLVAWVIMAGMFQELLSSKGAVNMLITALGGKKIGFLSDPAVFRYTIIVSELWKGVGGGIIIYLAALTNIDPGLYEAATMDGATRFQQAWHITLPMIRPTVILLSVLSLGSLLSASFDQIFNLYSPSVYSTGDVISTFMYRCAFYDMKWGPSAAIGIAQVFISGIFVLLSTVLADKLAGYKIW